MAELKLHSDFCGSADDAWVPYVKSDCPTFFVNLLESFLLWWLSDPAQKGTSTEELAKLDVTQLQLILVFART